MKVQALLPLLALVSSSLAFKFQQGSITSNGCALPFSLEKQSNSPVLFNETTSQLTVKFDIEASKQPDQLFIKVSDSNGVETSYKPLTKLADKGFTNSLTISYNKLPKLFTSESVLDISLIIADFDSSIPKILTKIGSIELTDDLISKSKYIKPKKFEHKPEIHHIFQQPPKTVNSSIAILFAAFAVTALLGLVSVWILLGLYDFKNYPGADLSSFAFIGLIFTYEIVFFQYYSGASIFQTISKALILLGPTVWFGSNVLNYAGSLRLAAKR